VATVVSEAAAGSVLLVTVNAEPERPIEGRVERLADQLGASNVPLELKDADLGGWKTAALYRRIINGRIQEALRDRNGALPRGSQLSYEQLFNFHYQDGARMLTVGGILYDVGQRDHVLAANFGAVACVRVGDDPYYLSVPNLTLREIRNLDRQLPTPDPSTLDSPGLSEPDLESYAAIYRYLPAFTYAES
jgi:hypothetical protein